jgi:prepilin-type N-terminal cleavage/methylation domain-containing protein
MQSDPMRFRHRQPFSAARQGFTLTEMLVVAGIIVLIVTLAVPALNSIMGNRSIDSAQNQLAAIIGRARQEAIGLQDYRGVILFQDSNTGRACAAEVYFPKPGDNTLDLAPAQDELLLPTGISFRTVETVGGYSPMNVIMFNNRGEFYSTGSTNPPQWTILSNPTSPQTKSSPPGTALALRIQNAAFTQAMTTAGMPAPAFSGAGAFGFVLFPDEGAYQNAYTNSPSTTYLTDNGITFLINKYNGILLRSE